MDLGLVIALTVFAGVALGITGLHSLFVEEPHRVRELIKRFEPREAEAARPSEAATLLKSRRFSSMGWLDRLVGNTNFAEKMALDVARAGAPL
ncbi:MAG: hypothetical protein Q8R28_23125, partial [Dehalococcoidia bacterium]|nr:hypothetical protein [Dehalococcoidia bacterium]